MESACTCVKTYVSLTELFTITSCNLKWIVPWCCPVVLSLNGTKLTCVRAALSSVMLCTNRGKPERLNTNRTAFGKCMCMLASLFACLFVWTDLYFISLHSKKISNIELSTCSWEREWKATSITMKETMNKNDLSWSNILLLSLGYFNNVPRQSRQDVCRSRNYLAFMRSCWTLCR